MKDLSNLLLKIYFIVLIIVFIIGMSLTIFTKEEGVIYSEDISCDKLRDCMILDISCYEVTYKNNFFGLKWDVAVELQGDKEKEYYKLNCMGEVK